VQVLVTEIEKGRILNSDHESCADISAPDYRQHSSRARHLKSVPLSIRNKHLHKQSPLLTRMPAQRNASHASHLPINRQLGLTKKSVGH